MGLECACASGQAVALKTEQVSLVNGLKLQNQHASAVLVGLVVGLGLCVPLLARELATFDPSMPPGTSCQVAIEKVHPTQFAVGYWEVKQRAANIVRHSPERLEFYEEEHLALLVVGPGGVPYLVDGHHLCLAMLKAGRGTTVEARVVANWRDLPVAEFWSKMRQSNYVYPYDNQGRGPLEVEKLPKKVTELTDDPYRSLAWAVRNRGGYQKTTVSFAEFQWANFFRRRITIGPKGGDFERAVQAALKISHTAEAKNLPGYTPKPGIPRKLE
jgi:hypothetical protein